MTEDKVLEKLRARYPGLEIRGVFDAGGALREADVFVNEGKHGLYRVFSVYWDTEEVVAREIEAKLALLRAALTPVAEDLEEDKTDE